MYLKNIELFGFKTFADSTIIEFQPQHKITAIVGPNGCGKSNVFDAVRWILGEQSLALLRSTSTEEIIFSGTDKRKAISLASAAITIDNSDGYLPLDYSEITIKRKVYRSGESEYFINKEPCRLKDIINLFLDTGLGRDSYFMIGQGQIESLLSSKPEERKAIFEEAAEINKYKNRRKAAEKKLKNAEQNLTRLNDLNFELKNRLEPLALQAKKAEEYIALKSNLKEIEIGFYRERVDRLLKQKQKLKEEIDIWLKDLNKNEAHKKEIAVNKTEIEEERSRADSDTERMREELNKTRINKENILGEKKLAKLNEQNCQDRKTNNEADIAKIKLEEEEISKQKQSIMEKLGQATLGEDEEKQKLNVFEKEETTFSNNWREATDKLEEVRENLFSIETEIVRARNDLAGIDHQKNIWQKEQEKAQKDLARFCDKKEEQNKLIKKLEETKEYLVVDMQGANKKLHDQENLIKVAEDELEELENKRNKVKEEYNRKSSKLYLLREMAKGYEGYDEGVRAILLAKKEGLLDFAGGIIGIVADIFETEQKHEMAIEVALEGRIQSIVTKDIEVAKKALDYLKQKNIGRASFLSEGLTRKDRVIPKIEHPGFIGIASNLVRTEHKTILDFLLGQTLIVDNLNTAIMISSNEEMKDFKIVTLQGDIIYSQGELVGGTLPKKQSVYLNRQKQILDLEKETNILNDENNKMEISVDAGRSERKNLIQKMEEIKESKRRYEIELKAIEDELARRNEILNEIKSEIKIIEGEILSRKNELSLLEERNKGIIDRQAEIEKEKMEKNEEAEALERKKEKMDLTREEIQRDLTDQKIKFAEKSAQKGQWQEHINMLQENLEKQYVLLREKEREMEYLDSFEREMKARLQEIEELIPRILEDEKIMEEDLKNKIEFKAIAEGKTRELEREQEKLRENHDEVRDKLTHEEIKLARAQADMDSIELILQEEHGASVEEVLKIETKIGDAKEAYRNASQYKKRLRELEPVNVLAVDEYKSTNKRYSFVDKQCQDLTEAKDNLEKLIKQLDKLAKSNFTRTINEIRTHFSEIFKKLFGGGKADLIISEQENILESSVDIFAQPPGKKLTNLNLLSGGEKALTGVALIFALLKVKPSPFCFLDEVDAPLDESNIDRFIELVEEFTQKTQMIIITHNKRTMRSANSLYGVTMEEMGISKLVSMKLSKENNLVKEEVN